MSLTLIVIFAGVGTILLLIAVFVGRYEGRQPTPMAHGATAMVGGMSGRQSSIKSAKKQVHADVVPDAKATVAAARERVNLQGTSQKGGAAAYQKGGAAAYQKGGAAGYPMKDVATYKKGNPSHKQGTQRPKRRTG